MKGFTVVSRSAVVEVNLTADQWQLFREPGVEGAALALNIAAANALAAPSREEAWDRMRPEMDRQWHYGASDTEPRSVFSEMLDEVYGRPTYG